MQQERLVELFKHVDQLASQELWYSLDQNLRDMKTMTHSRNDHERILAVAMARACFRFRSKLTYFETFVANGIHNFHDEKPWRGLLTSNVIHSTEIPMNVRKFLKSDIEKLISIPQRVLSVMAVPPGGNIPQIFAFELMKSEWTTGTALLKDAWFVSPERDSDRIEIERMSNQMYEYEKEQGKK
jgi:hypothetical protein